MADKVRGACCYSLGLLSRVRSSHGDGYWSGCCAKLVIGLVLCGVEV